MDRNVFDVIADLVMCFPRAELSPEHVKAYSRMLADIPVQELDTAAAMIAARNTFFPSISELRAEVFGSRLRLPSEEDAWQAVTALAERQTFTACPTCRRAGVVGDLDTRIPAPIPADATPGMKEMLQQIAPMGLLANASVCPTCGGEGEVPNPEAVELHPTVKRALKHIGGTFAIRKTDRSEILRSQFMKAYARMRDSEVEHVDRLSITTGQRELERGVA